MIYNVVMWWLCCVNVLSVCSSGLDLDLDFIYRWFVCGI